MTNASRSLDANTLANDSNTSKICLVTGSTGYIGSHVCSTLLSQGYTVHAAARTSAKGDALTQVLAARHPAAVHQQQRFKIVLVPDMRVKGAYDEAVQGKPMACVAAPNLK